MAVKVANSGADDSGCTLSNFALTCFLPSESNQLSINDRQDSHSSHDQVTTPKKSPTVRKTPVSGSLSGKKTRPKNIHWHVVTFRPVLGQSRQPAPTARSSGPRPQRALTVIPKIALAIRVPGLGEHCRADAPMKNFWGASGTHPCQPISKPRAAELPCAIANVTEALAQ